MIHRTICRDGRDQSILMGGSSVRHVELLPCRFMVAQVFDVWRCCCAPAWCRVDDRAERQRPARNDGRIRPQNVFAWLPCLEWLLFSFFIILPLLALSWSVYFLFSSFSCVSIFRPRYPYLDKKYIQYVAPCFDGDIVADLCAPHTHTQFISVPNWAHKYPLFPRFLSILVVISLRMRVQLVSGHSIGQRFYAFTSYAYEERRDHKMSLLLWGLCRPSISRLYIISQDLLSF